LRGIKRESTKVSLNIITLDIEMPIMDGKMVAKNIRSLESGTTNTRSHILMISGICGENEMNECLDPHGEIRANGFLSKPVSLEDLRTSLLNALAPRT